MRRAGQSSVEPAKTVSAHAIPGHPTLPTNPGRKPCPKGLGGLGVPPLEPFLQQEVACTCSRKNFWR